MGISISSRGDSLLTCGLAHKHLLHFMFGSSKTWHLCSFMVRKRMMTKVSKDDQRGYCEDQKVFLVLSSLSAVIISF